MAKEAMMMAVGKLKVYYHDQEEDFDEEVFGKTLKRLKRSFAKVRNIVDHLLSFCFPSLRPPLPVVTIDEKRLSQLEKIKESPADLLACASF